jgi:hypothetical protein
MTGRELDALRIPFHASVAAARWKLAAGFAAALMLAAPGASAADAAEPIKIAVFDFVLDDRSAAGGGLAGDPIDAENLRKSTDEARRRLADSGRYGIIDTAGLADEVDAAGGVQHCDGCDAPLAGTLGADQSMVGVVTRVSRTEYTIQIVVRDTGTSDVVSNSFTGLRMGANYAWPRGVKWLMENQILAAKTAE